MDWSSGLGAPGGDSQPVAVQVYETALPPGEPFLIDGNPELLGKGIDVLDIEVDQGIRPSVARVLPMGPQVPRGPAIAGPRVKRAGQRRRTGAWRAAAGFIEAVRSWREAADVRLPDRVLPPDAQLRAAVV